MIKKPALIFLFCVSAFFSQATLSEASILFAESFKIIALNGKAYHTDMLDKTNALSLRDGVNRIAVFYQDSFDGHANHSKESVRSPVYLLTVYLQKGGHYRQRVVKPHNAEAAKKFALNPLFDLIENSQPAKQSKPLNFKWQRLKINDPAILIKKTSPKKARTLNLSSSPTAPLSSSPDQISHQK